MRCIASAGGLVVVTLLVATLAEASKRPSLLNVNISHSFDCRGHQSTIDGRIFVCTPHGAELKNAWIARVFRPEAITYDLSSGKPNLEFAFSEGQVFHELEQEKSNSLAFCFTNSSQPFKTLNNGMAAYDNYIIDATERKMRRRQMKLMVSDPFSKHAEVHSFVVGKNSTLMTVKGKSIYGIEPTFTADGQLLVYKSEDEPALFYTYNSKPCAIDKWSIPRPLSWMHKDPNPALQRYPLSWSPLRSADGMKYANDTSDNPLARPLYGGAYPWLDHEGRNLVYVMGTEIVSLVGADTNWIAYNIDGAINGDRYDRKHRFYSGPMWKFEQERVRSMNFPFGYNEMHYLPVTKSHDVMPLFGSTTSDYNEVDVAELLDPFLLISLPMNEMVVYNGDATGKYDLTRTPDLSGNFFTGTLLGKAEISAKLRQTQANDDSLWAMHGKGKAMVLPGGGAVVASLQDPEKILSGVGVGTASLTVQFALRPDESIHQNCTADHPWRYIVKKDDQLNIVYELTDQLRFSLNINGKMVSLGNSPAIPVGEWSHVAFTWDGTTGEFHVYINGISTFRKLPVAPGTAQFGEGNLYIGADEKLDSSLCPTSGGGSFRGLIDEFGIYTHARSARSICNSAYALGADCEKRAITDSPVRPFSMSVEAPACTGKEQLNSIACQLAMHRGCAERGVRDAFSSMANLRDTILQVISRTRPPVSLAGVPVSSTTTEVTVGCVPIRHQSVAVEFEWLGKLDSGCTHELVMMSPNCTEAVRAFCVSQGWTTGQVFEVTSRPWVSCFNSGFRDIIDIQKLPLSRTDDPNSPDARLKVSQWCLGRGFGAGLIQSGISGENMVHVHCFEPSVTITWPYLPQPSFNETAQQVEAEKNHIPDWKMDHAATEL